MRPHNAGMALRRLFLLLADRDDAPSLAHEARLKLGAKDIEPNANLFYLGLTPFSVVCPRFAVGSEYGVEALRERRTSAQLAIIAAIAETISAASHAEARRAG